MARPWKYAAKIGVLQHCPPKTTECRDAVAYRFVHRDLGDPRNFLPVAMIPAARCPDASHCCTDYALSFFESESKAIARFQQLHNQARMFHKRAGGCIARVTISRADGALTPPSKKSGHFDLFEYEGTNLVPKATIARVVVQ